MASISFFHQDAIMQRLRQHLELPLLKMRGAEDAPHPNHAYTWDAINIMCHGIHRRARNDPSRPTGLTSGLVPSPPATQSPYAPVAGGCTGKMCFQCGFPCCYFMEQTGLSNFAYSRDPITRQVALLATKRLDAIAASFPAGVESYDANMACVECGRTFCAAHGTVCRGLLCRQALCRDCAPRVGGLCGEHRGE
jgi:hypothetical protein